MESKSALIIANASYSDSTLRQLVAPAQDAVALVEALQNPLIGGFEVTTLLDQPSHHIRTAVEEFFADRRLDHLLLAYYSGHGIKDEDGRLFFAAADTQLVGSRLRRATAVEATFVDDAMRRCVSRRQVLLLDCCYSGAFSSGLVAKGGASSVDSRERFEGKGRVVLTASDGVQYSFEPGAVHGEGVHSYFTGALVHGLVTGEADLDQDGLFCLDELYTYVYDHMRSKVHPQTPMKIGQVEGRIFLARNPRPRPVALPAQLLDAIASGWPATRVAAVRELSLLQKGPNQRLAAAALQELRKLIDDDSREVARLALTTLGEALDLDALTPPPLAPAPISIEPAARSQSPRQEPVSPPEVTPTIAVAHHSSDLQAPHHPPEIAQAGTSRPVLSPTPARRPKSLASGRTKQPDPLNSTVSLPIWAKALAIAVLFIFLPTVLALLVNQNLRERPHDASVLIGLLVLVSLFVFPCAYLYLFRASEKRQLAAAKRAHELATAERWAEAEREYRKAAAEVGFRRSWAYGSLGLALANQGLYGQADYAYAKALRLEPGSTWVRQARAINAKRLLATPTEGPPAASS